MLLERNVHAPVAQCRLGTGNGVFYQSGMKVVSSCAIPLSFMAAFCAALLQQSAAQDENARVADFRSRFFQLCDLSSAQLKAGTNKAPFFVDSYAVRALCVAYDMTGKREYLDACRGWSERMVAFQEKMVPRGAYYMNYNRKPGQSTNGWYVADSSSIAMGVLATAVRCQGAEKQRFVDSAKSFAALVMDNYLGTNGGIRNGLWPKFDGEWWCSSGIFGSLAFLLYDETGDERYLKVALNAVDWLNHLDAEKDPHYPLSEMGPTYPMYVLEAYSAGTAHLTRRPELQKAAQAKIAWYLDWIARQQSQPPLQRHWPANAGWGMKSGGLPFHQYVQSRLLVDGQPPVTSADREMESLAGLVFTSKIQLTQLPVFMMMSYAERLSPGTIYRSSSGKGGVPH